MHLQGNHKNSNLISVNLTLRAKFGTLKFELAISNSGKPINL